MVDPTSDLATTFRSKVELMKSWKPASTPSNRDRLRLYALHKQAVTGDAPLTIPSSLKGPEKAKYQAWRAESGLDCEEAMRLYIGESQRQVRVYGTATNGALQQPPSSVTTNNNNNNPNGSSSSTAIDTSMASNGSTTSNNNNNNIGGGSSPNGIPRGLAAIPLLCAAASESRQAYLRRLSQTTIETAWWRRQEPLCASNPSSISAIPEFILIATARLIEQLSLSVFSSSSSATSATTTTTTTTNNNNNYATTQSTTPLMATLLQAFLWPLHNCFLSLWIGIIVLHTSTSSVWSIVQTIVWGARRTGISLSTVWKDQIMILSDSISTICDSHQAVSCRIVGMTLLPIPTIVGLLNGGRGLQNSSRGTMVMSGLPASLTLTCIVYALFLCITWWYWYIVLPWLSLCLLGTACSTGFCFALIEFAEL